MPAVATSGHVAGFYHAQIAFRNASGYPMGSDSTPDDVSNGETKHAYKLTGPVSVTAPQVTRELATFRGGQVILGQRAMGVSDFGSFELTLSAYDETFNAYVSGSSVDTTTLTEWALTAPNSMNAALPQLILLLTAGFQDKNGANKYITYIYPNVQIAPVVPGATQDGGENPGALTYTVTPSASTRAADGRLFSALGMGVSESKEIVYAVRADKPISVTTHIQSSATSFTLGYRPTSNSVAGDRNSVTRNGANALASVTSINTTTGVVVFTGGSAGDIWVAMYETNFVAI